MDRTDAAKILAVLKAAYPHSFKDLTKRDAESVLDLWSQMFSEDPYEEVSAAVYALIAKRKDGYSPTVGEVKEQLFTIKNTEKLSEQSAWALVSKACQNGLYGYRKEFEKLPPEVQRAVGAPEQLKAWAAMDADTVESVISSNFMRGYKAQMEREKESAKLPQSVQLLIGGIAQNMKMIE